MKKTALSKPIKRKGKSDLKKAKDKAWSIFSKYIRLSRGGAYNGMCRCYTCGAVKPWKEMQAGHGIPGRNNAVLFMEEVVRPQCVGCNIYGHGKYAAFTWKLIDELGVDEYGMLSRKAQEIKRYRVADYEKIYEDYKTKVEEFEKAIELKVLKEAKK